MTAQPGVRQRILSAALDLVEREGVDALTQPRIAKAAGVRQSHLTYYFPRKPDLLVALLQASHERAPRAGDADPVAEALALMLDRRRMRFFLAIVLAAAEEPELRPILAAHAHELTRRIAAAFGRGADDPAATAFVDLMRGAGLRALLELDMRFDMAEAERLAATLGLLRRQGDEGEPRP
ncbi:MULTISPECIES: TetR/AcrR family transcriptional regulator [Methylosinus]|uniref:TetR/AcrR family transcriptional regulator n=1 Tax=Methylosinus TaxID=425 RepID=UPI00046455D4|nr:MULTISPECIES: TetR family transcriptional regulator [Methylosinus]OBS50908.1 TetR family transcriptional regulator [Methylosinus sp. 3S-1]